MVIKIFNNKISHFFLGIFIKFSACGGTFTIQDHKSLLLAEKFWSPNKTLEYPPAITCFC